jgi:hypothetical protein
VRWAKGGVLEVEVVHGSGEAEDRVAELIRCLVLWRLIGMVMLALTDHWVGRRRSALGFVAVVGGDVREMRPGPQRTL